MSMTQEQKELLLKDLSARLPYKTLISINGERYRMEEIRNALIGIDTYKITIDGCAIDSVKPYLFPFSSMTEEQKYEFYCKFVENDCDFDDFKEYYFDGGLWRKLLISLDDIEAIIEWFHKNHFDYRGLIPMGLANDATNLNIY